MSTEHRWSKFWWQDWQGDKALRTVSLAARGLWMELLCIAHEGSPTGHVTLNGKPPTTKQLASIVGENEKKICKLISELENAGVFSRTNDGTIFCRRMVRDAERSEEGRRNISKRWGGESGPPPNRGPDREPEREAKSHPNGMATSPPTANLLVLEAESESEDREERKGRSLRSLARAQAIPDDWKPTDDDQRYAIAHGVDPDRAAEEFANHWLNAQGRGAAKSDWSRAFRNRVLVLEDQQRFLLNGRKRGQKISVHEQIHRDLGTTSMLAQSWDDDADTLPSNLTMLQ